MKHLNVELSTTQIIALGFFCAILIGTGLLCIPAAAADGQQISFVDALFTSTTSICVTGLTVKETASYWSPFGQAVILILIQLGGLGIVSFTTAVMMVIGRFIVELIGMLGYSFIFVPQYGLGKGLWLSLFNAVSAFCNAGMDLLGGNSLADYLTNPWMNFVTMFLIIMGGIGFIVWMDIGGLLHKIHARKLPIRNSLHRLRLHTKLVLASTALLIFGGALLIFVMEYNNPDTIGKLTLPQKLLASLFEAVTTRTAGFYTFSQHALRPTTVAVCLFLMFIGGSSIGTAGGIKTTTASLLFLSARSTIRGDEHVIAFHRQIPHSIIKKALAVTIVSLFVLFLSTILLYSCEGGAMQDVAFETTSAIATVGLSRDYTPCLHLPGKLIIIILMYLGRIGPISMAIVFGNRRRKTLESYPEEEITVG